MSYPDEEHDNLATPEVVVSNGQTTAAIEVKRLSDPVFQEYVESMFSLERYLVPSCGGYYTLAPPSDFKLPMDRKLRRYVKHEIERVAPTLVPDVPGVILMPRQGLIALTSSAGPGYVHCLHGGPLSSLMNPLLDRVSGTFMLSDQGLNHSFFTQRGIDDFHQAVVDAWQRRVAGETAPFKWNEEWQLTRLAPEEDDEDGVYVVAVSEVRGMAESAADVVDAVLENVQRKFSARRWADLHVLVMEGSAGTREKLVQQVIDDLEPEDFEGIDEILLVNGKDVRLCYSSI